MLVYPRVSLVGRISSINRSDRFLQKGKTPIQENSSTSRNITEKTVLKRVGFWWHLLATKPATGFPLSVVEAAHLGGEVLLYLPVRLA